MPQHPWSCCLQMAQKCLPSKGTSGKRHACPIAHRGILLITYLSIQIFLAFIPRPAPFMTRTGPAYVWWDRTLFSPVRAMNAENELNSRTPRSCSWTGGVQQSSTAGDEKTATFELNTTEWHGQDAFSPSIRRGLTPCGWPILNFFFENK